MINWEKVYVTDKRLMSLIYIKASKTKGKRQPYSKMG